MMTNKVCFAIACLFLSACGHNLKFAANHFAVPVTAENQWGGHVAVGAVGVTTITVVDDITARPPNRDKVLINETWDVTDTIYTSKIDFNGSLSIYDALEVYSDSNVYGLRWQFLNHNQTPDQWVAAVQAGYGQRRQETSLSSGGSFDKAESNIKSSQAGISVGYKLPVGSVPYISYVYENHEAETKITNETTTSYGPYNDRGVHQSLGLGFTSYHRGLHFTIEYAMNNIAWDRAASTGQSALGGNIGFAW